MANLRDRAWFEQAKETLEELATFCDISPREQTVRWWAIRPKMPDYLNLKRLLDKLQSLGIQYTLESLP